MSYLYYDCSLGFTGLPNIILFVHYFRVLFGALNEHMCLCCFVARILLH
jgi:hypothetical protein